jgi:RNA polymerase sigma factor (sigma-70 family)
MTAAASVARKPNHEEIFLARYNRLLKWATKLTRPDHELAKDLVQDAFIQFTGTAGDLIAINNIDNYLFGVLRNTYLSHRRRSSRQLQEQLTDLEFDPTKTLQLSVDPRHQIQVADQLRAICQQACARKEASITGSILILRFFHGYVPSEVAKLIHSSRNIVDVQLRSARAEAIACFGQSSSTTPESKNEPLPHSRIGVRIGGDLLTELRNEIFATRRGKCFDSDQLVRFYRTHRVMSRGTLSHLVSCPTCLDRANVLLGLPLLQERNAIDVLGRAQDAGNSAMYSG